MLCKLAESDARSIGKHGPPRKPVKTTSLSLKPNRNPFSRTPVAGDYWTHRGTFSCTGHWCG
jgi:hypothetical protein